jgi:hypothetical protein
MRSPNPSLWSRLLAVGLPFYRSEARGRALGGLILLVVLLLTINGVLGERLYQALARSSITYVSVGCPPALLPYHDRRLELQEDGSWRVEPAGPGE